MPAAAATNGTPTTKDINSNGSGTPALAGHANHDMEDMGGPLQGVGADGSKVKDTDGDVPQDVRSEYTSKLVIYGSTQTHSVGKKVSSRSTRNSSSHQTEPLSCVGCLDPRP